MRQPIVRGSCAIVPPGPFLAQLEGLQIELCAFPTRPEDSQTIASCWDDKGGFALEMHGGVPCFVVGDGDGGRIELSTDHAVAPRRWVRIKAGFDPDDRQLNLNVEPLVTAPGDLATAHSWAGTLNTDARVASTSALIFAARLRDGQRSQHFDGCLDCCRLGSSPAGDPEAIWDFSLDIGTEEITDTGQLGLHGKTVQMPTRAVPGVNWTGEVHDWTVDASHYSAIHFHSDDLIDAEWESSCSFRVPDDLPSGIYALRMRTATSEDHAAFFVLPALDAEAETVAFLASTVTYRAYANHLLIALDLLPRDQAPTPENENDRFLLDNPECGLGHYGIHRDGHGVVYSSHKRPVLNLKPRGSLWSLTADTNVTAWLDHENVSHDVLTDDALHEQGVSLLSRYRVLVTGTHPEYWTTAMLDALETWLSNGGRLMVMGANGFYWRTAVHKTVPGVIELRRAEDGTRAWIAEPGEYVMESTGELGGLWRRIGRPPNRITGSGFSAMGFESGYYRRSEGWNDPRVAFAVEGLSDRDILGDHGNAGGGAAGEEIDRYDERLGSPSHAIVLASSEGLPESMLQTKEEFHGTGVPQPGASVRADVVFLRHQKVVLYSPRAVSPGQAVLPRKDMTMTLPN